MLRDTCMSVANPVIMVMMATFIHSGSHGSRSRTLSRLVSKFMRILNFTLFLLMSVLCRYRSAFLTKTKEYKCTPTYTMLLDLFTAEIFLKLGRQKEAAAIYRDLINRNPENWAYYRGYEEAMSLGSA